MAPYLKFCLSFFSILLCLHLLPLFNVKRALSLSSSSLLSIMPKKERKDELVGSQQKKKRKHGQKNQQSGHGDWSKGINGCPRWSKMCWRERDDLNRDLGVREGR